VIFHHRPTLLSYLGILIILSSAIYIAISKKASAPQVLKSVDEEVGLMELQDPELDDDERSPGGSNESSSLAKQQSENTANFKISYIPRG
jgi:hypothetical protein